VTAPSSATHTSMNRSACRAAATHGGARGRLRRPWGRRRAVRELRDRGCRWARIHGTSASMRRSRRGQRPVQAAGSAKAAEPVHMFAAQLRAGRGPGVFERRSRNERNAPGSRRRARRRPPRRRGGSTTACRQPSTTQAAVGGVDEHLAVTGLASAVGQRVGCSALDGSKSAGPRSRLRRRAGWPVEATMRKRGSASLSRSRPTTYQWAAHDPYGSRWRGSPPVLEVDRAAAGDRVEDSPRPLVTRSAASRAPGAFHSAELAEALSGLGRLRGHRGDRDVQAARSSGLSPVGR